MSRVSPTVDVNIDKLFPTSVKHTFSRSAVYGRNGMVAASQPLACDAGISILKAGGNAVDAAIAVAAALAVTEPCSTGIGGDAFLLYYHAKSGKVFALNGSGKSAMNGSYEKDIQTAFPDYFQAQPGDKWPDVTHGLTVTVPGASMAWGDAVEKWGSMKLSEILAPAINIATDGFPVSPKTATFWDCKKLRKSKYGKDMLMKNGVDAPGAGEIFQNLHLAQCLKEIGEQGPRKAFYEGRIGKEIVDIVQARGGVLTMEDLRNHKTEFPEPMKINYRGIDVYEHPPNGQGLCALLGLNILKESPLKNAAAPYDSATRLHYQIEAMRLAFADGRHYITDMDSSNPTPINELLSEDYTNKRRKLIHPNKATVDAKHGSPLSSSDTVSFQVVDKFGNAVSMVNSNYQGFGTGYVLNYNCK
jgi:gamma-glutamyltranspeptidase / glutathione hydrolase